MSLTLAFPLRSRQSNFLIRKHSASGEETRTAYHCAFGQPPSRMFAGVAVYGFGGVYVCETTTPIKDRLRSMLSQRRYADSYF
jgi:hypothetical protein